MNPPPILAPEALIDLAEIWHFIRDQSGVQAADRIEAKIFDQIFFIGQMPGIGHARPDLTEEPVKVFSIYSYLIVYRPDPPVHIVAVLHASRNVPQMLGNR